MTDKDQHDVHEGTEALKDIADEVVAEREQGKAALMPDDDTPEDNAATREDHEEDEVAEVDAPPAAANLQGRV